MKSIIYIKEENLNEALSVLEDSFKKQVNKFKGIKAHPFLEQSISQLGLLYKVTRKLDESADMYKNLAQIKETYYGEESESMITALKSCGQVAMLRQ